MRSELVLARVLVVEDSVKMAALMKRGLEEEGYAVDVASKGEDAVWMATEIPNDAIVLDVMLPDIDGFEVCRRIREAGSWSPVLMLTAREAVEDRVQGLEVGADPYLTRPFAFIELAARLRALVRRSPRPAGVLSRFLVLLAVGGRWRSRRLGRRLGTGRGWAWSGGAHAAGGGGHLGVRPR